ncbi:MAG: hypothetical protein WBC91_25550 [Phototrophicaceae bacterium]
MLDVFVAEERTLTAKEQMQLNIVREINPRLKNPLDIRLSRTSQKSYPPIEGLYLLLRASGLSYVRKRGKKNILKIDEVWVEQWNAFNPTEKYCHLLEAWILRGDDEILGGRAVRFGYPRVLSDLISAYNRISNKGMTIKSYKHLKDEFKYFPHLYHIALMDLFGIIKIYEDQPLDGDGWQIKKIEQTKFGEALLAVLSDVVLRQIPEEIETLMEDLSLDDDGLETVDDLNNMDDLSTYNDDDLENNVDIQQALPFSALKPYLQDYFPDWQNTIALAQSEPVTGQYTFKVSLGKDWSAEITLDTNQTFDTFAHMIITAVEFDSDHLYQFVMKSRFGTELEIVHPYADSDFATNEIRLSNLNLSIGSTMTFIFDFGDWWEFDIVVQAINLEDSRTRIEIKNVQGDPPQQYPDWDDEDNFDNFDSFATGFDFD